MADAWYMMTDACLRHACNVDVVQLLELIAKEPERMWARCYALIYACFSNRHDSLELNLAPRLVKTSVT